MAGTLPDPPHNADDDRLFLPGLDRLAVCDLDAVPVLQKNYGLDLKKSSLFFAGTLFCAMIAELRGGVVTDYLLQRTRSLQIARSLLIAVSWILAVASLVPVILVHNLISG